MRKTVPLPPLLLGFAGLLPPVLLTIVALFDLGLFAPSAPGFVRSYAAVILSFLGGSWWAFACRTERPSRLLLTFAVLPALAGWAAMFWFVPAQALFAMALIFPATLLVDGLLVRGRLAPSWWMKLRGPLSIGLALCCALSGWALTR